MTESGRLNVINGLNNSVQSRVGPNSHVSSTEIIIDGTHHTDDVKMGTALGLLGGDFT